MGISGSYATASTNGTMRTYPSSGYVNIYVYSVTAYGSPSISVANVSASVSSSNYSISLSAASNHGISTNTLGVHKTYTPTVNTVMITGTSTSSVDVTIYAGSYITATWTCKSIVAPYSTYTS